MLKSSIVKSTSASCARASKCNTALVLPPSAMQIVMPFSNAFFVQMSREVIPFSIQVSRACMLRRQSSSLSSLILLFLSTAVCAAEYGTDIPMASIIDDIVFAVNMPPQAPGPGHEFFSTASSSASVILPAPRAPIASNDDTTVMSFPLRWPGRMDPPYKNTPMELLRRMGMSAPGIDLSQPPSVTIPSAKYPSCMVSMESAIKSRETSEYLIPLVPIVSPSEITGVP
mmetsp:Transcript_20439/g.35268  ORF Transcript_20439/g.35268 Transcript_20439/m.35268 type:complete len:228 (+) Transcript_20439:1-684(+)